MASDPADEIAAALSRLRGRRPRPPFGHDEHRHHTHGHGGPWGRGAPPWADPAPGRFGGPARLRLLDALVAAAGSLSVSEIADAVGVDQPRASRLVQQATQTGLVAREPDPDDARRTRVRLTAAGEDMITGFRGRRRDAVRSALESFTDDERVEFARLLAKFADAWPRD
ncbi:MarR family winged helix-turn-helix transcriptional regulator [Microbacterium trichothecenolyticum]|uniref:DNA-binding MarR family transcriptional regulator n=1 Tax=Microbacterium trichothecenolyticum TaxID=69370 RepID=A0ABU0TWU7_MICTR|nr:MarR family winged helix-turn-helix transcriptional regulator [Microbacterium trichothecenolyticum]MDQ1124128.1 DNA-binding MarR family transcriptional regulator [Microbacterium trichothecenolyticum]